jgi:ParB family chromosome partitioning protein
MYVNQCFFERLERIEREKARERQGTRTDITQISAESSFGETRSIVAEQSGFGSRDTYSKAKFISDNATPELIAELDEGAISINKAYQQLKQQLIAAEKRVDNLADQL